MAKSKYLPPSVLTTWRKLKNDLPADIRKGKGSPGKSKAENKAAQDELIEKVDSLYKKFDKGLSKLLQASTNAKNDRTALVALGKARAAAVSYQKVVEAKKKEWTAASGKAGDKVGKFFTFALNDIIEATTATLQALAANTGSGALPKLAKLVAQKTRVPLPIVAKILQKHPLDKNGYQKAIKDCETIAAKQVRAAMEKINPF